MDPAGRSINYRLCTALDMTKLGIVLDEMVAEHVITPEERRCFHVQAAGLLASMRNANQKAWDEACVTPII